jgi:alpha-beta hydrolase superfamily lysophospholipase
MRWRALTKATRLAARHLEERIEGAPLYLIGYSNGATLALHQALAALEDPSLPTPDRLVLISPSIAVSPLARFAVWQARLGHWLGIEKLAWNSIQPEYDPYKYGSFAINAGDQVYRLTVEIQRQLDRAADRDELDRLPPVLAFQSAVDGTVSARAVLERLYFRLPDAGHELVLFDLDRREELEPFLITDPRDTFLPLLENHRLDFTLDVVTNAPGSSGVELWRKEPGAALRELALDLEWPADVYSLSHVALPFPPDDPLYGGRPAGEVPLRLGTLAQRGERGVFRVGGDALLRLRWNPFFSFLEERTLAFLGLALPASSGLEADGAQPASTSPDG